MKLLSVNEIYKAYDKKEWNKIGGEIYSIYKQGSSFVDQMAITWDEDINFYEGRHHYVYSKSTRSYQPRPITKYNKHIPRPTTNYIFPIVNAIVSLLSRNRPQFRIVENSDKAEDVNRAKLADALIDAKYEIDKELQKHIWAMKCACITGHVYRKDWWDTTGLQTVKFKTDEKEETYNSEYSDTEEVKDRYKDGKEEQKKVTKKLNKEEEETDEVTEVPLGDNAVSMLTPFQMLIDYQNAISGLDESMYIGDVGVQDIDHIKAKYEQTGKGFTGLSSKVTAEKDLSLRMDYFERRKGSATKGWGYGDKPSDNNSTVLIEMYIRPDKKHKKGLFIVCAGDICVYASESPYTYGDGVNWHPYSEFKYDEDPFRHYGISVVEQIVPLNKRINAIDSLTIYNRKTMASPQWVIPHGSLTPEQYPTGAPGQLIPAKVVNGQVPFKVHGSSLDSSVFEERKNVVQEMYVISGVNEILVGSQPSGVGTATALQILLEQTNNKFAPILQRLSKFIEEGQTKKANLIRRKYKEPRKDLINRIKAMNKDSLEVEIDDLFTGEALGDNLDVRVEGESMMPRSSIVEQSRIMDMINMQLYGDITPAGNPQGNAEIMRKLGMPDIPQQGSKDLARAQWENDLIRQSKFDEVEVLPTDEHVIHFKTIKDEIDRPEFYESNEEEVIEAYWKHLLEHFVRLPQQAYGVLMLSESNVEELQAFAMQMGIEAPNAIPTLEDRVAELEELAAQAMQATAGVPVEEAAPIPPAGDTGGLPMDIPLEGTPGEVLPPEMA